MKILVDTHIFIWASDASELLPNFAKKYLSDPNNRLIISAASLWEMQIKLAIGKLPLRLPLAEMVSQQQ